MGVVCRPWGKVGEVRGVRGEVARRKSDSTVDTSGTCEYSAAARKMAMDLTTAKHAFPELQFAADHPKAGGFKDVFFVESQTGPAVLKVYRGPIETDSDWAGDPLTDADRERIERELKVVQANIHPNIVSLIGGPGLRDINGATYVWYLEPRYLGTLQDITLADQFRGPLVLPLFTVLLDALAALHRAGYIHRDIKPDNVALNSAMEPVLIDFGIAFVPSGPRITDPGLLGPRTPEFAAPEQFDPSDLPDKRTDIFQLALTTYVIATTIHPFLTNEMTARRQPEQYLQRIRQGADRGPLLASGLSEHHTEIIAQCLGAEKHSRFRTADATLSALLGGH